MISTQSFSIKESYRHLSGSFTQLTLGQRVQWLLMQRGLTQTEAAKLMSVSQATIANIVGSQKRQPSAKTLMKMARTLNCAPSFIMDGTGSQMSYAVANDDRQAELLALFKGLDHSNQEMVLIFTRILCGKPTDHARSGRKSNAVKSALDP